MTYLLPDKLSDAQLVAVVLGGSISDSECVELVNLFVNEQAGPTSLKDAPVQIERLEAALELGRRTRLSHKSRSVTRIETPRDVNRLMATILDGTEERKVFHAILLDTKNHLKSVVEVSIGSLNASIVHPRELFKTAVEVSAASIVVTHNHPSGDPTPSGADIQLTRRLVKAGDVLGIEVLDHVVTGGGDDFSSLRELGLM
jgi:DNA repair protein RadC